MSYAVHIKWFVTHTIGQARSPPSAGTPLSLLRYPCCTMVRQGEWYQDTNRTRARAAGHTEYDELWRRADATSPRRRAVFLRHGGRLMRHECLQSTLSVQ